MGLFGSNKSSSSTSTQQHAAASDNAVSLNASGDIKMIDGGAFDLAGKALDIVSGFAMTTQGQLGSTVDTSLAQRQDSNIETIRMIFKGAAAVAGLALVVWGIGRFKR